MERDMFKVPESMASNGDNALVIEGVASTTNSNPLIQLNSFDFNKQDQVDVGIPLLSTFQRDTVNGFDINHQIAASMTGTDASTMASRPMLDSSVARDSHDSSCPNEDSNLTGQYAGGILIPAASLASFLMTRKSLENDLNNVTMSRPSMFLLDSSRTSASYDGSSTRSSSRSLLAGETFLSTGFQSSRFTQNVDTDKFSFSRIANAGVDQQNNSLNYNKDLSLSLASSLPFFYGTNIKDHCSYTFCSGGSHHSLTDSGFGSEKNSCHSTEISPSVGANKRTQFSHISSGSLYLQVIQNILAQIATYSLETLDLNQIGYLPSEAETGQSLQASSSQRHGRDKSLHEASEMLKRIEVENDPARRHSFESKKAQLLALLQVVDDCYNQCLDEMHTVVSAFHAVTELDPKVHACFAFHTVSSMYKDLRARISKQILAIGATLHGVCSREERSPDTSGNGGLWALEQLKRTDHQLWRPQRGLPERSVAVLKAWMFQNFLHPYPKDSEKHLLAIKSGLTRSQVSNWFINARVRIWKPLIEEMYSEVNNRKTRNNEGASCNYQGHMNTNNQS